MEAQNLTAGETPDERYEILESSKVALLHDQHGHSAEFAKQRHREGIRLELDMMKPEGLE